MATHCEKWQKPGLIHPDCAYVCIEAEAELVSALRKIAEARCADDGYDAYTAADRYREIARAALSKVSA